MAARHLYTWRADSGNLSTFQALQVFPESGDPRLPSKRMHSKNELSEQLEQEQNHRNGDHMECYERGVVGRRMGEKVQGIRNIIGRYKRDRERLRIVWGVEKPKNLYV